MIKALIRSKDGKPDLLLLGLSHGNLDKLRADGLKGFMKIEGAALGLKVDVMITAAETEQAMADALAQFIGPDTQIDDRRKPHG